MIRRGKVSCSFFHGTTDALVLSKDGWMAAIWFLDRRIGRFVLFVDIEKEKLIDTGFPYWFFRIVGYIVRGRELVFLDYWTPWLAGVVFSGCLDLWIDLLINQLLTQK